MPAYHSIFLESDSPQVIVIEHLYTYFYNRFVSNLPLGSFPLNPLRTRTRGPALTLPLTTSDEDITSDHESYDPVDEILLYFRPNVFFRNFEIKGPADRVLLYGILYVSHLLGLIKPTMNRKEAEKALLGSSLDVNFPIPGEPGFPFHNPDLPADSREAEVLRMYLAQVRQELASRLLQRVYKDDNNAPSKWWLSFTKRKFINKSL